MKAGYVVSRYPNYAHTFIVNEILAHEAAGLEVEIFSLNPPDDTHFHESIAQVKAPVRYLGGVGSAESLWTSMLAAGQSFKGFFDRVAEVRETDVRVIQQAIELAKLVGQHGVTHLHAHFATAPTTVAKLAASLAKITFSFTAHTEDILGHVDEEDLRNKVKAATCVVAVSDFGLEFLQQSFDQDAAKAVRIYHGLQTESLPFTSPATRSNRVVAAGPLVKSSGFDVLIKAISNLNNRGQQIECTIFGEGPLEAEFKAAAKNDHVDSLVTFAGNCAHNELVAALRTAAAFVAPSVVDEDGTGGGVPGLLLESMTLGTPCIASDAAGIPEIIVDGHTGIQTKQGDAESLGKAIDKVLGDEVLRVRLALKARVLVESEFNVHRNAARLRASFLEGDDVKSPVKPATNGSARTTKEREPEVDLDEVEIPSISL
ncbi:MAG: glycosyltransferase [Rhodothermales bacterium]